MRKLLLSTIAVGISFLTFAGGIVTNTNQSSQYIRTLSRNASTELDAVYFNPAGLTKMKDGFYLGIHNQSIFQKKIITNSFPLLNSSEYIGDVTVPLFPTGFAALKTGKFAFSVGFGPNGGGGSAEYKDGLPSFEMPISAIPTSLSLNGIPTTNYAANIYFNGSSVFWGYQFNTSYKINDIISIAAGVRYIKAKNIYEGSISGIQINPNYPAFGPTFNGSMVNAPTFFNAAATTLATLSGGASALSTGLGKMVTAGAGGQLLTNATALGLTPTQLAQAQQIIGAAKQNPAGLTIAQAQQILAAAAPSFLAQSNSMAKNATGTADVEVDATQAGTGYTPILSANISPIKNLDIAIKYEFRTKLELKNSAEAGKDAYGKFENDSTFRNDIPALLGIGAKYIVAEGITASLSWTHYFDKDVDWGGREKEIDKNLNDIAASIEYDINETILVSCGYLYSKTGVGKGYQTDLSHSLTSSTIGVGAQFKLNEKVNLNLSALNTFYQANKVDKLDIPTNINYTEEYSRKNFVVSLGLDIKLF